jgi:nitrite reductase/ring-hydroxylating ferredoxin subunit
MTSGRFEVVATNSPLGTICQSSVHCLPPSTRGRVRVVSFDGWREIDWGAIRPGPAGKLLLVCRLADIPEDVPVAQGTAMKPAHLVFVEDLPVEAIPARVSRLNVRDSHRLHLARERDEAAITAIIRRTIAGMAAREDRGRIVDAWIEGDRLVVLSPRFERLRVPVADLPKQVSSRPAGVAAFEIDEDGSYLYWPDADVHLGWEQLRGIVDPTTLVVAKQRSAAFNRRYGAAIRQVRESHGLKQTDIAGLADRHLRRIEHGQLPASRSALQSLAAAHHLPLDAYLAALARQLSETDEC